MSRPPDLPDFENPPVNEVILSIQFSALPMMTSAHAGLLWERVRDRYPAISEQPPIQPVFETFGAHAFQIIPTIQFGSIQIGSMFRPPMPRFWMQEAGGQELLQVQNDHLFHNWRRLADEDVYPRYEHIRNRFESDLSDFTRFLDGEGLGEVKPNQCDVTYINVIQLDGADSHQNLASITPLLNDWPEGDGLSRLENVNVQTRSILYRNAEPYCRVHVQIQPITITASSKQAIRMGITARGKPDSDSLEDAFKLLDVEHVSVVKTFAAITTPDMHKTWKRADYA